MDEIHAELMSGCVHAIIKF